jgi:hypothetical protein
MLLHRITMSTAKLVIAIEVKTLMDTSVEPHLRVLFHHRDPYSMFRALKSLIAPKVRALKYDCLNEFFNTKMEGNTTLIVTCPTCIKSIGDWLMNSNVRSLMKSESPYCYSRSLRAILHLLEVM